jgi:translation initiation factor 1
MSKKNDIRNVVYSTNKEFEYIFEEDNIETLGIDKQKLKVILDTKNRAGKKVTIVNNFQGKLEDLEDLSKKLKTKLGVGGTVKDFEIVLQGDYVQKTKDILKGFGYKI